MPLLHQLLLEFGVAQGWCAALCWQITVTGWITDGLRVWGPPRVRDAAIWRAMPLREHEKAQLSGCCYFSLGCTIAITFFPPAISTASILFLVLGDMSAALIGAAPVAALGCPHPRGSSGLPRPGAEPRGPCRPAGAKPAAYRGPGRYHPRVHAAVALRSSRWWCA